MIYLGLSADVFQISNLANGQDQIADMCISVTLTMTVTLTVTQ